MDSNFQGVRNPLWVLGFPVATCAAEPSLPLSQIGSGPWIASVKLRIHSPSDTGVTPRGTAHRPTAEAVDLL